MCLFLAKNISNFSSLPWKLDNLYYHISITDFFSRAFKILHSFHKSLVSIASTIRKYLYNFVTLLFFPHINVMPLEETLDIRYLLLIYKKTQIYVPLIYTLRAFVKKLLVYFCWHYFCKIPLSYPNFLNSLSTFNLGCRFRFRFMDLFEDKFI